MRCSWGLFWMSSFLISWAALPNPSIADECIVPIYGGTVTFGGSGFEYVCGFSLAPDGGSVVTGDFEGSVDFDPGPGEDVHVSNGNDDAYISSLGVGGEHIWTHTFGGPEFDTVDDVAIDGDGNIFVAGTYMNTVDFDPTDGVDEHTSNGFFDVFVSKYLSDGTYVWTRTVGGEDFDDMQAVAVAADGGVLATGTFSDEVDFDPGGGKDERFSHGGLDTFLLKLTSDGDYMWTVTFGGDGTDVGMKVRVSPDRSIVLVGVFSSEEVDFDPSDKEDIHVSNGAVDAFVSKYSAGGDYELTRTLGGSENEGANGMAVNSAGDVVMCGSFSSESGVDFDPTEGVDERLSNGEADVFVTALGGDGSYLWTWTAGAEDGESAWAIAADASGNIFVTGHFDGDVGYAVDFDQTGSGDVHVSNGERDVFVTMLEPDGSYGWTRTFGGIDDDDGIEIATGPDGQLVLTGTFTGTVNFDPDGEGDEHTSNGSLDVFVTTFECADQLPCDGDANGDGLVDPLDSGFVLARFGCDVDSGDPDCDTADMNGDGLVDPLDVGYVLARFGTCP
ncbi:MAG: hypothetical protein IID37_12455 [Planctomycetes bacterium]|nr:hypothetical protein [Planctomycetota bacterium]